MALDDILTTWRPVKPHVAPVVSEICATRHVYFVWGMDRSSGRTGDHPRGLALDFSVLDRGAGVKNPGPARPKLGDAIAAYLIRHRKRLNVRYVIWSRRIASAQSNPPWAWRAYEGKSPHTDHIHVSFNDEGTYHPPEDDMPTAREVAKEVLYWDTIPNQENKENPRMTLAGAISDIERTQDLHGKELAEIKKQLALIAQKLGA